MGLNKLQYIANFNKANYKMYQFRIKKSDKALIEKLDNISNRSKYITNLVLEDINPSILTIKQIRQRIKPIVLKHKINDVYLFGSYSRGEAHRDSDVDIYCDEGDANTLWKLSALKDELEDALGKSVDIVVIGSEMDDYFRKQLEQDMIKIC